MRIRHLVEQVDEQHREAMRGIGDQLAERHLGSTDAATAESRRRFMRRVGLGSAVAVGAVALPASLLAPNAFAQEATTTSADEETVPDADVAIAEFAQGLELAASAAYLTAVETRLLNSSQANTCQIFSRHHNEHAEAIGALLEELLKQTSRPEGEPNAAILASLEPQLAAATNSNGLFQILYSIEEGAAATYESALGQIETAAIAGSAASIQPIESQHAVVIGQLLDLPISEWLPAFQTTTGGFNPADYAG